MKQTFLDFEQPIAELQAEDRRAALRARGLRRRHLRRDHAAARRRASSSRRTSTASCRRGRSRRSRAIRSGRTRSTTSTACSPNSASCTATARTPTMPRSSAASRASTASPCMVIGHQKGRDTKEKILRNFGMPRPEGYRKALRLMKLAEKFGLPLFTFIDTPGAYPGIGAEERGQSEAIGRNLYEMAGLRVPIIVTVIGEGGSGGALAIAIGDVTLMLQYSTYSVISPEGCASILWKSAEHAAGGRRDARHHRAAVEAARARRQGRHRAARRRASRPRGDDGHAEKGADRGAAPVAGAADRRARSRRARTRSWLMDVQGDSRRLTTVRRTLRCSAAVARAIAAALPARALRRGGTVGRPRLGRAARRDACRGDAREQFRVVALHVDHGLSPNASQWAQFCRTLCAERGIAVRRCERGRRARRADQRRGRSAIRPLRRPRARLRAITVLRPCCSRTTPTTRPKHCCCNCCAVPGRAGSPRCPPRASTAVRWLRPWLDVPRAALDDYAGSRAAAPHRRRIQRRCTLSSQRAAPRRRAGAARYRTRVSGYARAGRGTAGRRGRAPRRPGRARRARCVRRRDARLRRLRTARRAPRGERAAVVPARAAPAGGGASAPCQRPCAVAAQHCRLADRDPPRRCGARRAPRPTRRPVPTGRTLLVRVVRR